MASDYDRRVQSLQEAILTGVVQDGASAVVATTRALSEEEISASWVTAAEDGSPLLRGIPVAERPVLEHSLRLALMTLAEAAAAAQAPLMAYCHSGAGAPSVPRLLDLALWLSQHKQTDYPGAAVALLEDAAELATTAAAGAVFAYLEASAAWLRRAIGAHTAARYSTLRICNNILRRLSKATAASLCGRMLIFLATIMPLDERSGVNLTGALNTSHSTPVEDVPEGATDGYGQPVDAELYRSFWGLQAAFQNPTHTLEPSRWAGAVAALNRVLDAFGRTPIALGRSGGSAGAELGITVKYLSSPRLMGLQLADAPLRRQFLVQALIFLQACRVPGKNRGAGLKPKQADDADALEPLIYFELQRTPECGAEFAAAVRAAMAYEGHWVGWKNRSCPPFARPPAALPQPPPPGRPGARSPAAAAGAARPRAAPRGAQAAQPGRANGHAGAAPPAAEANGGGGGGGPRRRAPPQSMGAPSLDRLWNQASDDVDSVRLPPRTPREALRAFLAPIILEMDPEEGIEEAYKLKRDAVFQWKARRQIARLSLSANHQLQNQSKGQPPKDLDDAVRALLPEAVPPAARRAPAPSAAPTPPAGSPAGSGRAPGGAAAGTAENGGGEAAATSALDRAADGDGPSAKAGGAGTAGAAAAPAEPARAPVDARNEPDGMEHVAGRGGEAGDRAADAAAAGEAEAGELQPAPAAGRHAGGGPGSADGALGEPAGAPDGAGAGEAAAAAAAAEPLEPGERMVGEEGGVGAVDDGRGGLAPEAQAAPAAAADSAGAAAAAAAERHGEGAAAPEPMQVDAVGAPAAASGAAASAAEDAAAGPARPTDEGLAGAALPEALAPGAAAGRGAAEDAAAPDGPAGPPAPGGKPAADAAAVPGARGTPEPAATEDGPLVQAVPPAERATPAARARRQPAKRGRGAAAKAATGPTRKRTRAASAATPEASS